nr:MAG TPA: hypothetical protein [Caudoviricetes sp.]
MLFVKTSFPLSSTNSYILFSTFLSLLSFDRQV